MDAPSADGCAASLFKGETFSRLDGYRQVIANPKAPHNDKADRNTYYSACRHAQVTTWKKMLTDAKGKDIWTVFRYTQPRKSQHSPPLTQSV